MSIKGSTTPRVQEYIRLHQSSKSTAQIAAMMRVRKNTIIKSLARYGVLRQAPGRDVELEVAAWTAKFAHSCYRMPGDHPFDLLVDWRRVDVKSASVNIQGNQQRYIFQVSHKQSRKDFRQHTDDFYLVLKDVPGRPVYRLDATLVDVKATLAIPADLSKAKYPLQLLGYLDMRGGV